jgi:histidinol-phosphate phosphatase family protein
MTAPAGIARRARWRDATPDPDRSIIFLDKDGTLIDDLPYNVDPRRIRFAPRAKEAVRLWAEHDLAIAIVTNQSGVARGYFTTDELEILADHLEQELGDLGARWAGFYACPHLPEGINEYAIDCDCRKPAPGLLRQAAEDLGADPANCWFIGDTWMDVVAGRTAGCRTILVGPEVRGVGDWPDDRQPDHAVRDLLDAARITVADRAGTAERSEGIAGAVR